MASLFISLHKSEDSSVRVEQALLHVKAARQLRSWGSRLSDLPMGSYRAVEISLPPATVARVKRATPAAHTVALLALRKAKLASLKQGRLTRLVALSAASGSSVESVPPGSST